MRFVSVILGLSVVAASGASAHEPHYQKLSQSYVDALGSCDVDAFGSLFADKHRGFELRGGIGTGFNAKSLERQCDAGYVLSIEKRTIYVLSQGRGYGSALIEINGSLTRPDGTTNPNDLRVSLMIRKFDGEPKIVSSHISSLY